MMYCNCLILIQSKKLGKTLKFPFCESVVIVSSRKNVGDYATVEIPYLPRIFQNARELMGRGDKIEIQLGYDGNLLTEFKGYIASLTGDYGCTLKCEDEVFTLKESIVKPQAWREISLKDALQYIVPGINAKVQDISLKNFRIEEEVTAFKAVSELMQTYTFAIYYRDGAWKAELYFNPENPRSVKYSQQHNCMRGALEYTTADEVKVRVKAISIGKDNKRTVYESGDGEGDLVTFNFYDLNEKELKAAAEAQLEQLKYTGLKGKFIGFGIPVIQHGDTVQWYNSRSADERGGYFCEAVTVKYGFSTGFKREIEISKKLSRWKKKLRDYLNNSLKV